MNFDKHQQMTKKYAKIASIQRVHLNSVRQKNTLFTRALYCFQGQKYLNIQDFFEKSLKMKFAMKSTGKKHSKAWKIP